MSQRPEAAYLQIVRELRAHAANAPYVTEDWILQVASMDVDDMRRRLLVNRDWHGHFSHCLDGIPEIKNLPGTPLLSGHWMPDSVRAAVTGLVSQLATLRAQVERLQAAGQVVAWRPVLATLCNFNTGEPTQADLKYWTQDLMAEIEYAYAAPAPSPAPVAQEAADTGADETDYLGLLADCRNKVFRLLPEFERGLQAQCIGYPETIPNLIEAVCAALAERGVK